MILHALTTKTSRQNMRSYPSGEIRWGASNLYHRVSTFHSHDWVPRNWLSVEGREETLTVCYQFCETPTPAPVRSTSDRLEPVHRTGIWAVWGKFQVDSNGSIFTQTNSHQHEKRSNWDSQPTIHKIWNYWGSVKNSRRPSTTSKFG